jgi:hypothetical protein
MRIVPGSAGSFLCPPGHPAHYWHVEDGSRRDPNLIAGIAYAIENEYGDVPEPVQVEAKKLMADATPVCSEDWVRHVYSYFRNCYSPDGVDRNASHCVIAKPGDEHQPPAEWHLGYLLVRSYFPDHELRVDLLSDSSGYGQKPCKHCGTTLQYEEKVDAWAVPISASRECPAGRTGGDQYHDIERPKES